MSLYEAIKDGVSIAQKADNIELYRMLLDMQKEALDMLEENRKLKEEVKNLQDVLSDNSGRVIKDGSYYFNDKGPYCTRCHDVDNKKVYMNEEDNGWGKVFNECPNCKNKVLVREYHVDVAFASSSINYD